MSKQKRKPKKAKLPFWKKYGPELQSVSKHIGAMSENMKFNDWADLALMGGLCYYGFRYWGTPGLLIAPLGFKLATTMGGTPPISQIAGVAILAGLGLTSLPYRTAEMPPSEYGKEVPEIKPEEAQYFTPENTMRPNYDPYLGTYWCNEGWTLRRVYGAFVCLKL